MKMNQNINRWKLMLLIFLFVIVSVYGWIQGYYREKPIVNTVATEGDLIVHFLDVGEGNATLLESDGKYMLVDGGVNSKSSYLIAYLEKQGVESFEYVIATHYDADHLAGIVGILHMFPIDTILGPDYETDTKIYKSFTDTMAMLKYKVISPAVGDRYEFGNAVFTIVGPTRYQHSDVNDDSIAIRIECGKTSFLIAGDAGKESEGEMVKSGVYLDSDVYLVNHHGSETSTTQEFLDQVNPRYAVISSGADGNNYGHPRADVLNRLKQKQVELFRTDKQGEIVMISDGLSLSYEKQPCNDFSPGDEPSEMTESVKTSSGIGTELFDYILNTKNLKIHLPECHTLKKMNEDNKMLFSGSMKELEEMGYLPCRFCLP